VPTSFLDLAEPSANKPARSRFIPGLLTLALVVLLVSGAVLFRSQVSAALFGMDRSGEAVAITSGGTIQPNAGTVNAAANVSAAVPTSAPLPANDAQGERKHVKSDGLNVRALPGTDQQVVAVLAKGDAVVVFTDARLLHDTLWVKVRAGAYEGWVDQSLLE